MLARIITERGHPARHARAGQRRGRRRRRLGPARRHRRDGSGPALVTACGAAVFVLAMLTAARREARRLMGSDRLGHEPRLLVTLALLLAIACDTTRRSGDAVPF